MGGLKLVISCSSSSPSRYRVILYCAASVLSLTLRDTSIPIISKYKKEDFLATQTLIFTVLGWRALQKKRSLVVLIESPLCNHMVQGGSKFDIGSLETLPIDAPIQNCKVNGTSVQICSPGCNCLRFPGYIDPLHKIVPWYVSKVHWPVL